MIEIVIEIPDWLLDRINRASDLSERSTEVVAQALIASEVVHTPAAT